MLRKKVKTELSEPITGLLFGMVMMIVVFLIVHFIFGIKAFS